MTTPLRIETTILPGHRIDVTAPELPEGAQVQVTVALAHKPLSKFASALEFLESLPAGPRAFPSWEEYERHLREAKRGW